MASITPVKELCCDATDETSVDFDWSEGYSDRWEVVYPDLDQWDAKRCREWLDDRGYGHGHLDRQDDDYLDGLREIVRERMYESDDYVPVMSYYYPLPNLRMSAEQAQAAIEDTNCVVVSVKDEYGDWETVLALSGGGMDLSWDICEAYMLLGYLPPLHFCRLPRFAGWKLTAHRAWIIAGCNRSCQVAMAQARSSLHDLRSVRHALKANNAA